MPRRRVTPAAPPLLYSSLSTRRSTFPTWLLINSSPTPHVVKRSDLGNEVSQLLISSSRAQQIPPLVNDIAASLQWLLEAAPIPLAYCYSPVAVNLQFVCSFDDINHIHPLDAHLTIAIVCMNHVLYIFFPPLVVGEAVNAVKYYLASRWGDRIHLVGFQLILLDGYQFLKRNYGYGFLYF